MQKHPGSTPSDKQGTALFQGEQLGRIRQRLLRHARVVVRDAALAEDLVQECLVAILEHPEAHRGQASLSTWATAILKNKIADWYRSPHQRRRVPVHDDDEIYDDPLEAIYDASGHYREAVPAWEQPDGQEAEREMMSVLEACLRQLPPQIGRVFMLREWLGFETTEICQQLGMTAENCRTILHRARTGLRRCMTAHGHSGWNAT